MEFYNLAYLKVIEKYFTFINFKIAILFSMIKIFFFF